MKKLFALLLAIMMVFALVACDLGGNNDNPGGNTDNPGTSQGGEENPGTQGQDENPDESNPPENNSKLEAPLYGWSEDDFKPDNIFDSMSYEDGVGYFINITEALTEETYKAWYRKLVANIEKYADNGEYTTPGIDNLEDGLSQAVQTFNAGGGALYIRFEYKVGNTKISMTTMAKNFKTTEEALYVFFRVVE